MRQFASKLCEYNIKTNILRKNVSSEKLFSGNNIYSDEVEKALNQKVESSFAGLLRKILAAETKIELLRDEMYLTKKFLLISIIRSVGSEELMQVEKQYYHELSKYIPDVKAPFVESQIDGESSFDYWMRTLNVIFDSDGTLEEILKHPNKTYPAYRWACVVNAGYLGIWDSEYNNDEFVITDVGMTSENEVGWNGVTNQNCKKVSFLIELYKTEKDPQMKLELERQLNSVISFHENFQMYSISAKRMIVLIAPFYKFKYKYKKVYNFPEMSYFTRLHNENLFISNDVKYFIFQTKYPIKHHKNDMYIYDVKTLTKEETQYCNALFLDRIYACLGFSTFDKVKGSILTYSNLTTLPNVPRNDYSELYKIIDERK